MGLLSKEQSLPFGCSLYASLYTYGNHVKATIVDEPKDYDIPIFDYSSEYFEDGFLEDLFNKHLNTHFGSDHSEITELR